MPCPKAPRGHPGLGSIVQRGAGGETVLDTTLSTWVRVKPAERHRTPVRTSRFPLTRVFIRATGGSQTDPCAPRDRRDPSLRSIGALPRFLTLDEPIVARPEFSASSETRHSPLSARENSTKPPKNQGFAGIPGWRSPGSVTQGVARQSAATWPGGIHALGAGASPQGEQAPGAGGGSRTHTGVTPTDFESAASAIPPLRLRGAGNRRARGDALSTRISVNADLAPCVGVLRRVAAIPRPVRIRRSRPPARCP